MFISQAQVFLIRKTELLDTQECYHWWEFFLTLYSAVFVWKPFLWSCRSVCASFGSGTALLSRLFRAISLEVKVDPSLVARLWMRFLVGVPRPLRRHVDGRRVSDTNLVGNILVYLRKQAAIELAIYFVWLIMRCSVTFVYKMGSKWQVAHKRPVFFKQPPIHPFWNIRVVGILGS